MSAGGRFLTLLLLPSLSAATSCLRSPAAYRGLQRGCRRRRREGSDRRLLSTAARLLSSDDKVKVNYINRDGEKLTAVGNLGDTLLDVVIENDLDIDGFGACDGTLACSTCHLIFEEPIYKKLDCIIDEEMDMLDLAYGLTDTSRLGCQICLKKWMDGMTVEVPNDVSDARETKDFDSCS